MYLSALELTGFKSFAKHTRLTFEPGVTCVVGPNGSGKSAVADAIRWVLGEQSLKSIRAKRSEDVIFAGSRLRPRLGMAEVSLALADASGIGLDTPELVITRRVDRGGLSEYLVNGRPVRLFDLADLLARAGFAQKSYTVIPQGMIDALVTASPQERRQMFEDATGVTSLLLKQQRTERKLEGTRQQILRARDLLRELEPRLRSLKRQAARARSRSEIETALQRAEEQYVALRWQAFTGLFQTLQREQQAAEKEISTYRAQLETLGGPVTDLAARAEQLPSLQQTLRDLREQERSILISVTRAEVTGSEGVDRIAEEINARTKEREKLLHELAEVQVRLRVAREDWNLRGHDAASLQQRLKEIRLVPSHVSVGVEDDLHALLADIRARLDQWLALLRSVTAEQDLQHLRGEAEELGALFTRLVGLLARSPTVDPTRPLLEDIVQQLEQVSVEHVTAGENLRSFQVREAALRERIRGVEERLAALQRQRAVLRPAPGPVGDLPTLQSQLLDVRSILKAREEELHHLQTALLEAHATKAQVQRERQRLEEHLRAQEERRTHLAVRAAEANARREDLLQEAQERLATEFIAQLKRGGASVAAGADPDMLRVEIEHLRKKFMDIGAIDASVLEEETILEKRVTELHTQVADLEAAQKSLRTAMKELARHIHERFTRAFQEMSESFHRYFREIFGGGRAALSLLKSRPVEHVLPDVTGEEERGEERQSAPGADEPVPHVHELPAGVEIHAHLPGKKISSLTQLSGGEKTLTSIALLCAILQQRASPFVVLDEVDAALDEANSRRFTRLLQTLAERTQFIVISHNRATMEAAKALYGVTMGEDGMSQLLSVRLENVAADVTLGHSAA